MIDPTDKFFAIEDDFDTAKGRFVRSLPDVIERHMRTSAKWFRPSSLQEDFKEVKVWYSRQAINSALLTLTRKGKIVKEGRGLYCHAFYS